MLIYFALLNFAMLATAKLPMRIENYLQNHHLDELKALPLNLAEDSKLSVVGLITKYGYPVEIHEVRTKDGYLLTLHRIPGGRLHNKLNSTAIFLQHGILSSSTDWIINGPGKSLGYLLADAGFDVWMGNARGNTYSRKHVLLDPNSAPFWGFSWHEIGCFDLPAMIDYVLRKTESERLHYIGYSQGTTTFFVMATKMPEYNKKIISMHALSPVAYMGNLKSPIVKVLSPLANTLGTITSLIGLNEFFPSNDFMKLAAKLLCEKDSIFVPVCTNALFLIAGYNPNQLNMVILFMPGYTRSDFQTSTANYKLTGLALLPCLAPASAVYTKPVNLKTTMLPVYLSHTPGGSSSKQFIHYAQEFVSKQFRQYDYGMNNKLVYGSSNPPKYDPKLITTPVFLYYGDNDWLSDRIDVLQFSKELRNLAGIYEVPVAQWNHLDFIWAKNAKEVIYDKIIKTIRTFN